jgi:beta-lactamase regulating signal transducer with metallopeptidase domain
MESKTKNLLIILSIFAIIATISLIIIYKKFIREKNVGDNAATVRIIKYDSAGNVKSDNTKPQTTVSPVVGFLIFFFVILIFAAIFYMTILRYRLAYKSLESGNTAVGLAALSPEIGSGIGSIFR